jgi:hypothetical protein
MHEDTKAWLLEKVEMAATLTAGLHGRRSKLHASIGDPLFGTHSFRPLETGGRRLWTRQRGHHQPQTTTLHRPPSDRR